MTTDPNVPDAEVGAKLRAGVGLERMRAARRDPKDRLQRDHGHLALIDASFTYLREFVPHVISTLRFEASVEAKPLAAAVDVLRELYARGGRKVPEGAPTEFVPTRWRGYLDQAAKAGNTSGCCRAAADRY